MALEQKIFEQGKYIFALFKNKEAILSKILIPEEEICEDISQYLNKEIGKLVYEFKIPGDHRRYIAKKTRFFAERQSVISELSKKEIKSLEPYNVPNDIQNVKPGDMIFYPRFNICKTNAETSSMKIPGKNNETILFPAGSYICQNPYHTELIIGAIVGDLYRKKRCINFFGIYFLISCRKQSDLDLIRIYDQYLITERTYNYFKHPMTECVKSASYIENIPESHKIIRRGFFIQVIFAIALYQDVFKLSHNSLHLANLFVECVTNETMFNDTKLIDAKWYHYHLREKDKKEACDLYLPAIPVIAKISISQKSIIHSNPVVGERSVLITGYNDPHGIPNVYIPSYDSTFFAINFNIRFHSSDRDDFLNRMIGFLTNCITSQDYRDYLGIAFFVENVLHPKLELLPKFKTAEDLLRSSFVQEKYGKKPISGKIVTLGTL